MQRSVGVSVRRFGFSVRPCQRVTLQALTTCLGCPKDCDHSGAHSEAIRWRGAVVESEPFRLSVLPTLTIPAFFPSSSHPSDCMCDAGPTRLVTWTKIGSRLIVFAPSAIAGIHDVMYPLGCMSTD